MPERIGRQGDIVRVPELGPIRAKEGSDLVALFLGACEVGVEPDVPAYLRKLGFQRTHAFEVTTAWEMETSSGDHEQTLRHIFLADSPREALEGAIRFSRYLRESNPWHLVALGVCLMRMGPIGPDGRPHNGRGQTFARWSIDTGRPLEALLECPATAPSPPAPSS